MSDTLLTLGKKQKATHVEGHPLWQSGFRPFFLLAGVVGAVSILGWLALLHGARFFPGASTDLHVHEMVFGFVMAVIAGFLLTAVKNWTGLDPAPPAVLAILVGLFVVGRIAVVLEASGVLPGSSVVELLFLPALVAAVGRPIVQTRNRRNAGVLLLLIVLAVVDVAMHGAAWAGLPTWAASARAVALLAPCVLIAVVGGRVIPIFTRNALGPAGTVREAGVIDTVALVAAVLMLPWAALAPHLVVVRASEPVVDVVAGVLVLLRMRGWATTSTLRHPIVWILHVGFALLGVGFIMRGLPTVVPSSAATHLLAVGCVSVMSLGMMTRVSLGHTGRPLTVPGLAVVAYVAMLVATVTRVAAAWFPVLLDVAGALLALALVIFVVAYLPILWRPRADGKSG